MLPSFSRTHHRKAQIMETYLLADAGITKTMIASKKPRAVVTACGRDGGVVEFGARRAHSAQAGIICGRGAAAIGGGGGGKLECSRGTNNLVFSRTGRKAHSWVMAHDDEADAVLPHFLGRVFRSEHFCCSTTYKRARTPGEENYSHGTESRREFAWIAADVGER